MEANGEDKFKKIFKYYKANILKPHLKKVVCVNSCNNEMITSLPCTSKVDCRTALLGLQPLQDWELYSFRDHSGLLLIKNPFTSIGQRYWIRKCLETYPQKPNKTNIDTEMFLADWWAECFKVGQCNEKLQKKLRWTTLGYHHNWDTKVYSDDNRTTFPEELSELSDVVACYLGYSNFKAEAAIVNYYHMDSTLSPHTDHSEVNLSAPLLSFSFGQSAVFLIGGKDKSTEPTPILLNSGDIIIMSKEARLCYHAVPKILSSTNAPWNEISPSHILSSYTNIPWNHDLDPDVDLKYADPSQTQNELRTNLDDNNWHKFSQYIQKSRINMNVRQVLNERQKNLIQLKFNAPE